MNAVQAQKTHTKTALYGAHEVLTSAHESNGVMGTKKPAFVRGCGLDLIAACGLSAKHEIAQIGPAREPGRCITEGTFRRAI
jgi:hypothetical protein